MGFLCLPYNSTLFDEIGPALSGITSVAQIFVELWNNWQFELASMGFAYVLG